MIQRIAGLDDPRVSAYAHVGDPRWLAGRGLFVAEGRLIVRRLVEDRTIPIQSFLITPAAAAGLDDVLAEAAERCPVYLCSQAEMDATAGINFHRGCLALAQRPALPTLSAFASARMLVGLEEIGNPDNVEGVFRNALAFGAGGILLDRRSADPFYRKAIRTSMGAVLRVPFTHVDGWPEGLQPLRDAGFVTVALTPGPDAEDIAVVAASPPSGKLILLFGSEASGLSPAALAACDLRVRIPISPRGDSLNVAVAVGIALHRLSGGRAL